jgi:hypothetical protein
MGSQEKQLMIRRMPPPLIAAALVVLLVFCELIGIWSERRAATRIEALSKEHAVEANRVFHPRGFSIIRPANWVHRVYDDPEDPEETSLNRICVWASSGRYTDTFHVQRIRCVSLDQDLDAALLRKMESIVLAELEPKEVLFQKQRAIVRLGVHDGGGSEDPTYTYGAVHFRRGEMWYEIRFHLLGTFTEIPSGLWQFFETFQES